MEIPGQNPGEPVTTRDKACAVLARAALFPISVDWSGKHHVIQPAVQALDLLRNHVVKTENVPFSKLFPRYVIVVPSPTGEMQWNGQPDITGSSIEVIPNKLNLTCSACRNYRPGTAAFVVEKKDSANNLYKEIVLCTDRVLQGDYDKVKDPSLLEQRRDLPPRSLAVIQETLAHQIAKVHQQETIGMNRSLSSCETLAKAELYASRLSECLYQKEGGEVHRGSALRPSIGFSLLPQSTRLNFVERCARSVAIQNTALDFKNDAKKCVQTVLENGG